MQNEKADCHYLSIDELSRLIGQKKVSSTEIVKGCLIGLERLNPPFNVFG